MNDLLDDDNPNGCNHGPNWVRIGSKRVTYPDGQVYVVDTFQCRRCASVEAVRAARDVLPGDGNRMRVRRASAEAPA